MSPHLALCGPRTAASPLVMFPQDFHQQMSFAPTNVHHHWNLLALDVPDGHLLSAGWKKAVFQICFRGLRGTEVGKRFFQVPFVRFVFLYFLPLGCPTVEILNAGPTNEHCRYPSYSPPCSKTYSKFTSSSSSAFSAFSVSHQLRTRTTLAVARTQLQHQLVEGLRGPGVRGVAVELEDTAAVLQDKGCGIISWSIFSRRSWQELGFFASVSRSETPGHQKGMTKFSASHGGQVMFCNQRSIYGFEFPWFGPSQHWSTTFIGQRRPTVGQARQA